MIFFDLNVTAGQILNKGEIRKKKKIIFAKVKNLTLPVSLLIPSSPEILFPLYLDSQL